MLSTDLSAFLRLMAATFPLNGDEQRQLKDAAGMLERVEKHLAQVKEGLKNWQGIDDERAALIRIERREQIEKLTAILEGR